MKTLPIEFHEFTVNKSALAAAFTASAQKVFKEDSATEGIKPTKLKNGLEYMPWGVSNDIPFKILDQIEQDETINTCMQHNIKNCYAAGLEYTLPENATDEIRNGVQRFMLHNDLTSFHLGMGTDMKYWDFAVTLFTLNQKRDAIASIHRLESMYCRFSPKDAARQYVFYGQWRDTDTPEKVQRFVLLDPDDPLYDLEQYMQKAKGKKEGEVQFAMVTRFPTPDSTYYPIPYYASLFKGKWYDIKQLIAIGKYSKLKNAAPLKYIITIQDEYWQELFQRAGITDEKDQQEAVNAKKTEIINFLTGAENSGRAIFTGAYLDPGTGKPNPYITITNLEQGKEGGDWETDIQEAINMVCFVMGVHSNLVGSVPGKSQSNNSGSDKRELYMIAQLLNKPTHDLMMRVHQMVCYINKWEGVKPECKIMQLTTLDEHKDIKQTNDQGKEDNQ